MEIKGFYHVCMVSGWQSIFDEQLELIVKSKLYEKSSEIIICCLGQNKNLTKLKNKIVNLSKIKILKHNHNIQLCEYYTLASLQNMARRSNFAAWYIHTKGVTSGTVKWRRCMDYFIIERHEYCCQFIKNGFDAVGAFFYGNFFAGNFWWTKSSHLRRLIDINELLIQKPGNRFAAEFDFIASVRGKYKNLFMGDFRSQALHYRVPKML